MRSLVEWTDCDWFQRIVRLQFAEHDRINGCEISQLHHLESLGWCPKDSTATAAAIQQMAADWQQWPNRRTNGLYVAGYRFQGRFMPNGVHWLKSAQDAETKNASDVQLMQLEMVKMQDYLDMVRGDAADSSKPLLCHVSQ